MYSLVLAWLFLNDTHRKDPSATKRKELNGHRKDGIVNKRWPLAPKFGASTSQKGHHQIETLIGSHLSICRGRQMAVRESCSEKPPPKRSPKNTEKIIRPNRKRVAVRPS